jgi:hypothetical protein
MTPPQEEDGVNIQTEPLAKFFRTIDDTGAGCASSKTLYESGFG